MSEILEKNITIESFVASLKGIDEAQKAQSRAYRRTSYEEREKEGLRLEVKLTDLAFKAIPYFGLDVVLKTIFDHVTNYYELPKRYALVKALLEKTLGEEGMMTEEKPEENASQKVAKVIA